jgi:D-xylose transport system ATP-binding protein
MPSRSRFSLLRRPSSPAANRAAGDAEVRRFSQLTVSGLGKRFGTVTALVNVHLEIPCGQVTALVGDNGAGKSTLVKVLSGVHPPDSGTIELDGEVVHFESPSAASRHGVHTVYQDLALADNLDVVENLFLGSEICKRVLGVRVPWIARRESEAATRKLLDELGITTIRSINQRIEMLSGGQRQTVAIARSVKQAASLVILDEPTAALGVVQSKTVMQNILRVRTSGAGVLLVSHNLREVFAVADRIAVMRLGECVGVFDKTKVDEEDIVGAIVGSRKAAVTSRA